MYAVRGDKIIQLGMIFAQKIWCEFSQQEKCLLQAHLYTFESSQYPMETLKCGLS